ncbi:hypothetical protein MKX01_007134 [Papaver californicum]|nr:hypothetical protein MKX01_007134 [Papaver californicum]
MDINILAILVPAGTIACFLPLSDASSLAILYIVKSEYFSVVRHALWLESLFLELLTSLQAQGVCCLCSSSVVVSSPIKGWSGRSLSLLNPEHQPPTWPSNCMDSNILAFVVPAGIIVNPNLLFLSVLVQPSCSMYFICLIFTFSDEFYFLHRHAFFNYQMPLHALWLESLFLELFMFSHAQSNFNCLDYTRGF